MSDNVSDETVVVPEFLLALSTADLTEIADAACDCRQCIVCFAKVEIGRRMLG